MTDHDVTASPDEKGKVTKDLPSPALLLTSSPLTPFYFLFLFLSGSTMMKVRLLSERVAPLDDSASLTILFPSII